MPHLLQIQQLQEALPHDPIRGLYTSPLDPQHKFSLKTIFCRHHACPFSICGYLILSQAQTNEPFSSHSLSALQSKLVSPFLLNTDMPEQM